MYNLGMTDIIKAFEGQQLRIKIIKGKEWFCVTDVGRMLGLKDPQRRTKNLPQKGVRLEPTLTKGGKQETLFVNESCLYRLIFQSKKDSAVKFQDWIFEEVIPSIRKTGEYKIPKNLKKLSTENRKVLTDIWRDCGIEKKHHFIQLTLQEYKALGFEKGKKKKDMDKGEVLLLSALESMEALKLFHDPKGDYYSCKDSLYDTAKVLPEVEKKEIDNG